MDPLTWYLDQHRLPPDVRFAIFSVSNDSYFPASFHSLPRFPVFLQLVRALDYPTTVMLPKCLAGILKKPSEMRINQRHRPRTRNRDTQGPIAQSAPAS